MFDACLPLMPSAISKLTFWPSLSDLKTVHIDCRKVRKQVTTAIIGGDKTKTLCVVEPFDCTGCHDLLHPSMLPGLGRHGRETPEDTVQAAGNILHFLDQIAFGDIHDDSSVCAASKQSLRQRQLN
jgi:hypothetical protein